MSLLWLSALIGCASVPAAADDENEPAAPVAEAPLAKPTLSEPLPAKLPPPVRAPEPWPFVLEEAERWESTPGVLATMSYPPSDAEKPFFERAVPEDGMPGYLPLSEVERTEGAYGNWIGIIRGYRVDEERNQTRLLVETKHFDGLTDTHILCVSFYGGGDVVVLMPGTGHAMNGLSLLRIYGTVVSSRGGVPRIHAEFIREFPLGQYCFMNFFGADEGNPRWRELCTVDVTSEERDVYDPGPDLQYYVDLLGHPRDFVDGTIAVEVPLD